MKYVVRRVYMCLALPSDEDVAARICRWRQKSWFMVWADARNDDGVRFIARYCAERPCHI